jgi:hypothetical protein
VSAVKPRVTALLLIVLCLSLPNVATGTAVATGRCHPPRLTGLTLSAARASSARAGCALSVRGVPASSPSTQTIRRQAQVRGSAGRLVVWLNSVCPPEPASLGGPAGQPLQTRGASELITGLYVVGGPLIRRSAPDCAALEGTPGAGTVTAADAMTGATVAVRTVTRGHLATIALPPGAYTVTGVFDEATISGEHPAVHEHVVIPGGTTVRQDVDLAVP